MARGCDDLRRTWKTTSKHLVNQPNSSKRTKQGERGINRIGLGRNTSRKGFPSEVENKNKEDYFPGLTARVSANAETTAFKFVKNEQNV